MLAHTRNAILFAAAALFAAGHASPQAAEGDIVPPKPIYKVDPQHPPVLYERGTEGEAVIIASVDMFGSVQEPVVEKSTDEEFGLAALLAASEWIFEPASKNGVPIEIKVRIPFEFRIAFEHKLNVEFRRQVFRAIDVPITPSFELDHAPLPTFVPAFADFYPEAFRNTGVSAAASLEFIIDPTGNVVNPRIISVSAKGFEHAALRAVASMRYRPIKVEGHPAYVSMMMPIQLAQ